MVQGVNGRIDRGRMNEDSSSKSQSVSLVCSMFMPPAALYMSCVRFKPKKAHLEVAGVGEGDPVEGKAVCVFVVFFWGGGWW